MSLRERVGWVVHSRICDDFIYTISNSAPFRGRVVERSVERSETEGLISPQKKRGGYKFEVSVLNNLPANKYLYAITT